jgi:hypothetical protein
MKKAIEMDESTLREGLKYDQSQLVFDGDHA